MIQLHRHLAFPRNVFVHAVFLDEGRLEDPHYGIYANPKQPYVEAQHSHVKMMLAELPKTPGRVLVLGYGVGSTVRAIRRMGHRIVVVTSDLNEARIASKNPLDGVEVVDTLVESFPVKQPFDAVIAREVGQNADIVTVMRAAQAHLVKGGRLVMAEDLPADIAREAPKAAQILGFAVGKSRGLSEAIRPTLDHLTSTINKHRERMKIELRMSDDGVDRFLAVVGERSQKHKSGASEYLMMTLLKA